VPRLAARCFSGSLPLNIFDALRNRRSVGKLEGPIDESAIDTLLEMALLAPNHKHTEPWTFTVLTGAARERLGKQWAAIAANGLAPDAPSREARLESEARKLTRAPAVIVVSVRTDADPVVAAEDFAAGAAAVQNMLLAAVGLGLGAIWRSGAMAYKPEMNIALGLVPSDRIVGLVYVGRPAAEPKPRESRRFAVRRIFE
jgi:nitroreductase